jgi:uncharacterized repeat protein (TIGR03803 family)
VADTFNDTIREMTHTSGSWTVSTVAGLAGVAGSADGLGTNARFYNPCGVALDSSNNLFVADTGNQTIRLFGPQLITSSPSTVQIPADADIFGAGEPALPNNGGGAGEEPVEIDLPANAALLTVTNVSGTITLNNGGGHNDADGTNNYFVSTSYISSYAGISGIIMPGAGAIVGVFEPATAPTGVSPATLDFTVIGTNFNSLSPVLYQTFYIGDGLTGDGSGSLQQFVIPTGATRLFLGIADAISWNGAPGYYGDNSGSFTASFQISLATPVSTNVLEYGDEDLCNTGTYSSDPKAGATLAGLAPGAVTYAVTNAGQSSPHSYPFAPTNDYPGTDQIFVGSHATTALDGYASSSEKINGPQIISLNYSSLVPAGQTVTTLTLGIEADDFQAPYWGNPYTVMLNGVTNAALTTAINNLNETGPYEQFLTIGIDPAALQTNNILILSIDEGGNGGDGWAIDFLTVGVTTASNTAAFPPTITAQPPSEIVTNGSPAFFAVGVSGAAPLFYQWQKNGTNLTDGGNISGSATNALSLIAATTDDAGNYSIIITNAGGSVTSSVVTLSVVSSATNLFNVSLPLTTGSTNKLDLGSFAGGQALQLSFVGHGDLVNSSYQTLPDGSLFAPAGSPYGYANPGSTNFSTIAGGDGINHYPGGGGIYDAGGGSGFPFAGKATTDTTDPAGIRDGAVVGTFNPSPANTNWFDIGYGGTFVVPAGGAHLYIAVNDTVNSDDHGVYFGILNVAVPTFSTTNLLLNPGAETGTLTNWTIGGSSNSFAGSPTNSLGDGFPTHSGNYYFVGGSGSYGSLSQIVSLIGNQGVTAAMIDNSNLAASVSFWEQGLSQGTPSDDANITLTFLGASSNVLTTVSTPVIDSHNNTWSNYVSQYAIPSGTRFVQYTMDFYLNQGGDLDAFIDDNYLSVIQPLSAAATSPVISSQPQNLTVTNGQMAAFSAQVSGTAPLVFEWQKNGVPFPPGAGFTSVNVTNTTLTQIVSFNAAPSDDGNYSVIITNAYGSVTSSVVTLTVSGVATPPPTGLVSWWRAESNALDSVGSNNGTLVNGATFASGEVGTAFSFGGTSNYVSVPSAPALNPTNAISIEAWVYANGAPAVEQGICGTWDDLTGNNRTYLFWLYSGHIGFYISHDGSGYTSVADPTALPTNTWVHVAATYDGTNMVIYRNGVQVGLVTYPGIIATNSKPFFIGRTDGGGSFSGYWDGQIDEVSIYNRALSSNEIAAIYAAGSAGKISNKPYFLTATNLPNGVVNVPYSQTIAASVTTGNAYSLIGGSLPAGLILSTNGLISGMPTVAGTNNFTILATSSLGQTNSQMFTLALLAGGSTNAGGTNFIVLHTFSALVSSTNADGVNPFAGLLLSGGRFYGAAEGGGSGSGTVFAMDTNGGNFTVLHNFNGSDGDLPQGNLALSGGTLYGTTEDDYSHNSGEIFAVNTNGSGFTVLYSFTNSDHPAGSLLLSGGTLYGTTEDGGTNSDGSVFAFNIISNSLTVLYQFSGNDGENPRAGLALLGNTLYGTTDDGGTNGGGGNGVIFAVNTNGAGFTVLHDFNGNDGKFPFDTLIVSGNTIYGTTSTGGAGSAGVIFSMNTNGAGYTNLYNFSGPLNDDGVLPYGGLTLSGGTLYGTTAAGGTNVSSGTIFQINTDGSGYVILHNLSIPDGTLPWASLVLSGNTLYGTAYQGGTNGNGTVFALPVSVPSGIPPAISPSGEPQSLTVTNGSAAGFVVTASGSAPFFYQWQKDGVNLTDGTNASGSVVVGSTLYVIGISPTTTNDAGNYAVIVTNFYGSVTSSVAVLTVIAGTSNPSVSITWTNASGGSWNNAANWSPNQVPGPTDTAIINTGTATVSTDTTVGTLNLGNGAVLNGSATLTINNVLNWGLGTMGGAGRTVIASGATANLNSSLYSVTLDARTLENEGTMVWNGGAISLYMQNGAVVTNGAGGTFQVQNNETFSNNGGSGNRVDNAGTFQVNGAGTTTTFGVPFNNYGTVQVQNGTLTLGGGATSPGSFTLSSGTTLNLNGGTAIFSSGSTINGLGANLTVSGGTANLAGLVNVSGANTFSGGTANITGNYIETNGVLNVSGGTANFNGLNALTPAVFNLNNGGVFGGTNLVTVGSALNWGLGTMGGAGRTVIASGATANLNSSLYSVTLDARTLENEGTMVWNGGAISLYMQNGAVVTNGAGGTFQVQNNETFSNNGGSGNRVDNAGTFQVNGAGTTTTFGVPFNNYGAVDLQSGILSAGSGFNVSSNSALDIAVGGTSPGTGFGRLQINGYVTLAGTLNVTFKNGFQPVIPDTFTFLTVSAGVISGNFAGFLYPSNVVGMSLTNTSTSSTLVVTNNTTGSSTNGSGTSLFVLHTFSALAAGAPVNADGAVPWDGLILSGSTLYGTASEGGSSGSGAIFRINTDGSSFTNLLSFNGSDGADPFADLILSGNMLYGTTYSGGSSNNGTVFAINTDGSGFTNLYSFSGGSDGNYPSASLILSGNTLYGTTYSGGSSNNGTVFAINTDGSGFTNLYRFSAINGITLSNSDGSGPRAGLILSGNTLYGTAAFGGTSGYGTVFAVNTDGTGFTNLYNFTDGSDGANPYAGLILSGNTLYGTAAFGGSSGGGTVFAVNTDGTGFTNLHTFYYTSDGDEPYAGLILSGNTLYGTASEGGSFADGTMFAVNTDGTGFTNLYSFTGGSDGANPQAGLILSGSTLYGTAYQGGTNNEGTVFALTLSTVTSSPVQIVSPQVSGGSFNLSFQSVNGQGYTLYYNDNLATTNWLPYTNVSGNGGTLQLTVPLTNSTQRFFRISEP